jgi:membrane fusion protein (multidrug efflux system)
VSYLRLDFNRIFELTWRILVFLVALTIIAIVSTNWTRREGGEGWQRPNDAYRQSDLTPVASKLAGYLRDLPIEDYERVQKGRVLAHLVDDDYRAAVAQTEAGIASATAQTRTLRAQRELRLPNIAAAHAVIASTMSLREQNRKDLLRQLQLQETGSC